MPLNAQKEEQLLCAMTEDSVRIAQSQNRPSFLGFLNPTEKALAEDSLRLTGASYSFCGGHDDAERVILGVFPEYMEGTPEDFPISAVTALYRSGQGLTHRDFLGALMSLGVERNVVGDILVEDGRCVFFVKKDMARYITSQLTKVGNTGVKLTVGADVPYPPMYQCIERTATLSSLRLDCFVSVLAKVSRDNAAATVKSGLVFVDGRETDKPSFTVDEGSVIAIRGKGKFKFQKKGSLTKKGRVAVIILQYK